jgi:hypothetical protein
LKRIGHHHEMDRGKDVGEIPDRPLLHLRED